MTVPQTQIDEIEDRIYRIHTPVDSPTGEFSFNQYLLVDDAPLLFHTGPRGMAPAVMAAIGKVMPIERLRYVGFAHFENDECGGLNAILAQAPHALPVCSTIGAMVQDDALDRPARALADGEALSLGERIVRWIDAPHVPHGWDNGYLYEERTKTLLCGDLFTQPGSGDAPLVETDVLGPSEAMRAQFDYFAHSPNTVAVIERLAKLGPRTLACMHGSAFRGDGGKLLRALAEVLDA